LVGFSGLMLTCLEDEGMAAGAAAGHYDIREQTRHRILIILAQAMQARLSQRCIL
jgi:hypothetical protein